MNCQDIGRILDTGKFGALTDSERRDAEAHAFTCRHCAPRWGVHSRMAGMSIAPMPQEFAAQMQTLVAARSRRNVIRFAPRTTIIAGSCMALAAAAAVVAINHGFVVGHRDVAAIPAEVVVPVQAEPAPVPPPDIKPESTQGESDMKNPASIAATIVVAAVAAAPAQSAEPAAESRQKSAEEIIATNDLNRDGIVTREEAAKVNGNLFFMWNAVYDMDHDDRVDVAELKRAMGDVELGTALDKITGDDGGHMGAARPQTILANNDENKDGVVTKEEATKAGKALIRMWDSYDFNKDGKVDLAELSRGQGY